MPDVLMGVTEKFGIIIGGTSNMCITELGELEIGWHIDSKLGI